MNIDLSEKSCLGGNRIYGLDRGKTGAHKVALPSTTFRIISLDVTYGVQAPCNPKRQTSHN